VDLLDIDGGTLRLAGPDGKEAWVDRGVGWSAYDPLWVEVVRSQNRLRVHMMLADGKTIVAMSPWLSWPETTPANALKLVTRRNTARFAFWGRTETPLTDYTPNNPSALRIPQAGDTSWSVVGGGAWRWRTTDRQRVQQIRPVERTTLVRTSALAAEGTWRAGIRLDKGTCGGGFLVQTDAEAGSGFLVWCGGKYGNGSLMLYRLPLKSLWSSPQGKWRWDTDYVLEATIEAETVRVRMLAADGETEIAASPRVPLLPEEKGRRGMVGYQTWRGTGSFRPAGDSADRTDQPTVAVQELGDGWQSASTRWTLTNGRLRGEPGDGAIEAHCQTVRGARGVFRCRAISKGATELSLTFQHADSAGFVCRLNGKGLALAEATGKVLWSDDKLKLKQGTSYQLEGIVDTDRVMIRVRDDSGKVLAESVERYVSDTNNDRVGCLGVDCADGAAEFSDWGWSAR
jgi:hypothetical protein